MFFAPIKAGNTDHASGGVKDARRAEHTRHFHAEEAGVDASRPIAVRPWFRRLIADAAEATVLYNQLNKELAG